MYASDKVASLFEHGQYLVDAGASLDQWPSIPVKGEIAALIFGKAKKDELGRRTASSGVTLPIEMI